MKLSDCVHVAEASGDPGGCPKDTIPFLLETTDKRYLLAADSSETAGWVLRLCELAFPVSSAPKNQGGSLPGGEIVWGGWLWGGRAYGESIWGGRSYRGENLWVG